LSSFGGIWGDWTKFLIDRKGKMIDRFDAHELPNDVLISGICKPY